MPTEPKQGPQQDNPLTEQLVADLEKVTELVRAELTPDSGQAEALALVRVVKGVPAEYWESFASTHGLESWLCIPLHRPLGESVSTMLSIQERLAFQRDHDALTNIGNRGYFNRRFETEVERAMRSRSELTIIYIDLDNFKAINDTHGHACGDIVLKRLGSLLQSSVRHYDIVARLGGEEFAIILPATSCWAGIMLGNRILEAFSQEVFSCGDASFSMTFSGGVSSLSLLEEDRKSGTELLRSADTALYEAKRRGKNNITLAESNRFSRERESLVQAQEKQFLFSFMGSE